MNHFSGFSELIYNYIKNMEPYLAVDFEEIDLVEKANEVVILGKKFTKEDGVFNYLCYQKVKEFVRSRLWMTYRKDFTKIGGTGPSSDQGWGCMLRCGQMLLAQAIVDIKLGKDWIWDPNTSANDQNYIKILNLFQDDKTSNYSIHQIAQMGVSEGKNVGEWLGPNTVSQVLKKLVFYDDWSNIRVHVAMDNVLIHDDVKKVATVQRDDQNEWKNLLIIIPLRLGLTSINRDYIPAIKMFYELKQCAGIIGGRPNRALYFIGMADEEMLYLDPHICQPVIDINEQMEAVDVKDNGSLNEKFDENDGVKVDIEEPTSSSLLINDASFHCDCVAHMDYEQMDPSLALAFVCKDKPDYDDLTKNLETVLKASLPPLFEMLSERPKGWPKFVPYTGVESSFNFKEYTDFGDPNMDSDDEFEVLS
uniref:Cysteine protease n=1 Tax=Strongyloides venezuelensis TaxID=75913 RepID=A0A0K0F5G6_STRVS